MKFKPGDRVQWDFNGVIGTIVRHSGTDNIWVVDLPSIGAGNGYCYERNLTLVGRFERKRRGFASFVHRIEGN